MQLPAKGRNNPVMTVKNTTLIPVLISDDNTFSVSVRVRSLAPKTMTHKTDKAKRQVNFYNDKYDQ